MSNVLIKLKQAAQLLKGIKLTNEPLVNGSLISYTGEQPEVGADVLLLDEAGNASVLPDGSYKTKSNISFTIKQGAFETVNAPTVTAPKSDKPVVQAQSAVEVSVEVVEQATSGTTSGDTSSATTQTEQAEEVKQADVTPTDAPAETIAQDAANAALTLDAIGGLIDKKLLPVWDAINALANLTTSYPTFLSAVEEMAVTVNKLSAAPSAAPIEKSINPLNKVPKDIKESTVYKILHSK